MKALRAAGRALKDPLLHALLFAALLAFGLPPLLEWCLPEVTL